MNESADMEFLARASGLAENLCRILEEEFEAMSERDAERLSSLTEQKSGLLDSLSGIEPGLADLLDETALSTQAEALRDLMLKCRELNQRNSTVAFVELDQARKTASLMRNLLQIEEQVGYDADGGMEYNRDKRYLSSG